MSFHSQLVLVLGVTTFCSIGAVAFTCWLVWSLFWDLYDYLMQQRTRRRNAAFDARVGQDCYRDLPGVHR